MKLKAYLTIFVGVLIIAVLTPLSQFLTIQAANAHVETATPSGWVYGLLISFVLAGLVFALVARRKLLDRGQLVILFSMLAIAVPIMNLGLVRLVLLASSSVLHEYMHFGTSTYRTAYEVLNPAWSPVVPTDEGLAFAQADRLLTLLDDPEAQALKASAVRVLQPLATDQTTQVEWADFLEGVLLAGVDLDEAVAVLLEADNFGVTRAGDLADILESDLSPAAAARYAGWRALRERSLEAVVVFQRGERGETARTVSEKLENLTTPDLIRTAQSLESVNADVAATAMRLARERRSNGAVVEAAFRDFMVGAMQYLDIDGVRTIANLPEARILEHSEIAGALEAQSVGSEAASAEAAATLPVALAPYDELVASMLPSNVARTARGGQNRMALDRERRGPAERAELEALRDQLAESEMMLRETVATLSSADRRAVRDVIAVSKYEYLTSLSAEEVGAIRGSLMYRMSRDERNEVLSRDGTGGEPEENLSAFRRSLWVDQAAKEVKRRTPVMENLQRVVDELPWHIWAVPLLMWSLLFACIFLFLMSLAEWLRRKWVDRENLSFPLVEIADNIIRHNYRLELASDVTKPEKRKRNFYPYFLIGGAIGFIMLAAEALGHYGFFASRPVVYFNFNEAIFTDGATKEIYRLIFVLSPIVIGICFLLSLEVLFSIWFTFFIYTLIVWFVKLGLTDHLRDSQFLGWGGGKLYPFLSDQLIGACVCYAIVVLWKSWGASHRPTPAERANAYVPPRLATVGLIVLPFIIFGLLWHLGVSSFAILGLYGVILITHAIAAARVRAETGLPAYHVSSEFSRLPMMFGLTSMTGSRTFAATASIVFLPLSLLFRTLPQQLENMELARRNGIPYKTVGLAGFVAFFAALGIGLISLLVMSYYVGGEEMFGTNFEIQGAVSSISIATTPLWVTHFLGEFGLDTFDEVNMKRMLFIAIGFFVIALLVFLRGRFLRFPLHPVGYMVILLSVFFPWVSPYITTGTANHENSWLWGSAFLAWLIKKIIVKYGGMNTYKRSKPFFIGLVVGSIACIFLFNVAHLIAAMLAAGSESPGTFLRAFIETAPFTPSYY